jgi:ABC-2 type transport system permease protein
MKDWILLLWAEMKKEHRNTFHNHFIYFSLLVWPVLKFITAYFSFLPFQLGQGTPLARFLQIDQLALFLLTGYLGYLFFWCLVQSAWQLSFERQSGTMEMIFITPVNRMAFIYGRSFSSLVEGVWLFFSFSLLGMFFIGGIDVSGWWAIPFAFLILLLSAVVWGGFLTVLFLFSRDSSFLFTVLDEPMQMFAGVGIPPLAFPIWAKIISFCFPLTYALHILRQLLMNKATFGQIGTDLMLLAAVLLLLVLSSAVLLKRAERHMKQTGSMVLY